MRCLKLIPKTCSIFFIINIGVVSTIVYMLLNYFVKKKDSAIDLMRTNRELELAYLQQEVMLRQNEKLATLGRLSAGLAHELNNPAAAAQRGSRQLQDKIPDLEKIVLEIGLMNLTGQQLEVYRSFKDQLHVRLKKPIDLDPITRSDRETEIESWLKNQNVPDAWELASMMVYLDFSVTELAVLSGHFSNEQFQSILLGLQSIFVTHNLLDELGQGSGRITEIVKSLKSPFIFISEIIKSFPLGLLSLNITVSLCWQIKLLKSSVWTNILAVS